MTARALLLLGLALSVPAHALTLGHSIVSLDPSRTDGFVLSGRYSGALAGDVAVTIDRFVFRVAANDLKHKGNTLRYRAPKGTVGLTSLLLIPKRGRFVVTSKNLVLTGLPNPVAVQVGPAAGGGDCAMVRFQEHSKKSRRGSRTRLSSPHDAGPCRFMTAPRISPASVVTGASTLLTVRAQVTGAVDGNSLQVFRLGAGGVTDGAALCTLVDDGVAAHGDQIAGDGTFGCAVDVTEATPGLVPLVVQGTGGGKTFTSPGFLLPVVRGLADGDVQAVLDAQTAAWKTWTDASAHLGDGLAARVQTLRALRGAAGVLEAALSPDGLDIVVRYASGLQGGLMLSPRAQGGAAARSGVARGTSARSEWPRDAGVPRAAGDLGLCDGIQRTRVRNTNVLVFDPGYFPTSINTGSGPVVGDEAPGIASMLSGSCLGMSVTSRTGPLANVDAIRSAGGYGTVILVTHGLVDANGGVDFLTGEPVSATSATVFGPDLGSGALDIIEIGPPLDNVFTVTPEFIAGVAGGSDHIVYAGHCWSTYNASEATAWAAAANTSYFGYTTPVSTTFAATDGTRIFDELVNQFRTTGDALKAIPLADRVDPDPTPPFPAAIMTLFFTDENMAYVGTPTLSPTTASVPNGQSQTYTVTLDGGDSCDLRYHWTGGTAHGHVEGDGKMDDFTTTSNSASYAATGPGDGDDGVRVDVLPPESATNQDPLDTFCALATVSSPHVLHVVFDGQGTSSEEIPHAPNYSDSANVSWHAVYDFTLPGLERLDGGANGISAGPGTTVTGTSTISSTTEQCSGAIVVNTSHGPGTPPAQAQTPFMQELGATGPPEQRVVTFVLDVMGGYDYRLCDGEMNIGVGPFAPPPQGYPSYAPGVLFATLSFTLNDFTMSGSRSETFHLAGTEHAVSSIDPTWMGSVSWGGTITLSTSD
jgi:hypothetical protein